MIDKLKIKVFGIPNRRDDEGCLLDGCIVKVSDIVSALDEILADNELITEKTYFLRKHLSEFV